MNIQYFQNSETMSQKAANLFFDEVRQNPRSLICTATGSSPKPLYQLLVKQNSLFSEARIIPLDEWIGLSTLEGSCHTYIEEFILDPLQIPISRYFGFNADAENLEKECKRIQKLLIEEGPIDVCILGLGRNGHLGFNEPAEELQPLCHIANLAPESQEHGMIGSASLKPTKGLTLGMRDILAAKKIILLVSGEGKESTTKQLLSGNITNDCPASWLWKHNNVDCFILK